MSGRETQGPRMPVQGGTELPSPMMSGARTPENPRPFGAGAPTLGTRPAVSGIDLNQMSEMFSPKPKSKGQVSEVSGDQGFASFEPKPKAPGSTGELSMDADKGLINGDLQRKADIENQLEEIIKKEGLNIESAVGSDSGKEPTNSNKNAHININKDKILQKLFDSPIYNKSKEYLTRGINGIIMAILFAMCTLTIYKIAPNKYFQQRAAR